MTLGAILTLTFLPGVAFGIILNVNDGRADITTISIPTNYLIANLNDNTFGTLPIGIPANYFVAPPNLLEIRLERNGLDDADIPNYAFQGLHRPCQVHLPPCFRI